ncbi:MAG: transketolase [Deltaproteobacteria bacterium]|nr:transketolase [Deltaproteobacteria bacterium]
MTTKCPAVSPEEIDIACINTIRTLAMDAIQKANSGHPGAPMGLAPAAYVLWTRFLRHNPKNTGWINRDRFVLSGGHASMLLYSLLFLTGYGLTLDDIKSFRQWGSKTPGHPEYGHTPGVETTTGPLGQGIANAVGMAMAQAHQAAVFNRPDHNIINHFTYVMCGDGDMMEGISAEAASLAGHLGLGSLICLYDDNRISIEGSTSIAFTEDVGKRFEAQQWQVIKVDDGNDIKAIADAISAAKDDTSRPTLIMLHTHIAYGSPHKQDTADAHGAPLGEEEISLTKEYLGCPPDKKFCVPDEVLAHFRKAVVAGKEMENKWNDRFNEYSNAYPDDANLLMAGLNKVLPDGWEKDLPVFPPKKGPIATRGASGTVLNALAPGLTRLMGGSADLAPSNKTIINTSHDFQKGTYDGRNIRFGVREHAMASIANGMCLYGGIRPYCATFLVFADYMRPAIRLAALMKQPVIYVFTHDSIAVGEDGPTHQPVEHLASLRAIPGLVVLRPADANETARAWEAAVKSTDHPVALILSRQKLPVIDRTKYASDTGFFNGAYVLADCGGTPDIILIGTGAETHQAIEAREILSQKEISARVVSMPSWELFEAMPRTYRDEVLPLKIPAIAIEAGIPMGWERYVGENGTMIGMTGFGASAPGNVVLEKFGFTAENMVNTALKLLGKS